MQQFDPNIPGLIGGDVTTVVVIDPAGTFPPFEVGNHVLNRNDSFQVNVAWDIDPPAQEDLAAGPRRQLERPDVRRVHRRRSGDPPRQRQQRAGDPQVANYSVTLNVQPDALDEGDPGSNVSGIYKLVVSVFLDSNLGSPGFDMTGFNEGPIIQVENPV